MENKDSEKELSGFEKFNRDAGCGLLMVIAFFGLAYAVYNTIGFETIKSIVDNAGPIIGVLAGIAIGVPIVLAVLRK